MNRLKSYYKDRQPKSKNILLVDDEQDTGWILQDIANDAGHRLTYASSFKEGIQKFKRSKTLDMAIVDLNLGNESGLTFVRRVKRIDNRLKLIMMSAYGAAEEKIRARQLGVRHFLDKPVKPQRLLDIIARL